MHYYSGKEPCKAIERFYAEWVQKNDWRADVHIWLTEFRFCNQWWADVPKYDLADYMRRQIRAMEALPYLDRYAYFSNRNYDPVVTDGCDIALNTDDGLTNLGKVYMSL